MDFGTTIFSYAAPCPGPYVGPSSRCRRVEGTVRVVTLAARDFQNVTYVVYVVCQRVEMLLCLSFWVRRESFRGDRGCDHSMNNVFKSAIKSFLASFGSSLKSPFSLVPVFATPDGSSRYAGLDNALLRRAQLLSR